MRRLVLDSAHQLFAENGYHATTTRQIAQRAGVGEPVIYRNFGSKAGLFEAAILTPFKEFIDDWARTWDRRPAATADHESLTRSFVKGYYALVEEHKDLLGTLIAARVQGADSELDRIAAEVSANVAESLRVMRRVLLEHGGARDYKGLDPPATVAVAAGAVMSQVLLSDWIFAPDERPPSRARRIEELTQMLLHGVAGRE